jgi:uncharacterized spore protein YtfJ
MFRVVEGLQDTASADVAFGKPEEIEGRVLISVAAVSTGFGMGFGQAAAGESTEEEMPSAGDEGGGAGGGSRSRPVAVIEVTPEETIVKPIVDEGRIALAGIALVAWAVFWVTATLRAIFGHE